MYAIDNCIVSEDIADLKFVCDIKKCAGICCKEGDAGAPLDEEEIGIIEDYYDDIMPYMCKEGIIAIEENGSVFDYDAGGNFVTPLINDQECAFSIVENGVFSCAIEKAWKGKVIDFQKPISCHLYPVRIGKYDNFDAINYHHWHVCKTALIKGNLEGTPLYRFLKEPLIRKYGEEWFAELEKQIQEKQK